MNLINSTSTPFYEWLELEQDLSRKQNLPRWEELKISIGDDFYFASFLSLYAATEKWEREEKLTDYWEIAEQWAKECSMMPNLDGYDTCQKIDEFRELKFQKKDLETNLNNIRQQLDQIKSELTKKRKGGVIKEK